MYFRNCIIVILDIGVADDILILKLLLDAIDFAIFGFTKNK